MFNEVASFSGLASGIQWRDMIDEIMTLESAPIMRLEEQITLSETRASAWTDFRTRVENLQKAALALESGSALRAFKAVGQIPIGGTSSLTGVSASADASPGSHLVNVLANATAEKLGSSVFASRTTALGLAGELRVNGKRVEISASDTLDKIVQRFNGAGAGVNASILTLGANEFRLVLTSAQTGAAGIDLVDGAAGVLQSLGLTDANTSIKHATSSGAKSDAFSSATAAVTSVLGFAVGPPNTVMIGGEAVTIDLATDSLASIAQKINDAAALAGKGFSASVIDDTSGGTVQKRLEIKGTTSFTDAGHTLETLGVLQAGHGSVAQVVRGAALTNGDASTPATAATSLANLWSGGAAAGVQVGDTLTLSGTRGDGSAFSIDYTVGAGDTLQTVLDRLNDATDGLKAGTRTATASIGADGAIVVTDDAGGSSRLALSIVAHNEGGGTLDFGTFATQTTGIARQIADGADAEVEIDGAYFTSASNTITDAVAGLTLNVGMPTGSAMTVNVTRDVDAAAAAVKAVVDSYNQLTDFVAGQLAPPAEGAAAKPLYSNSVLRTMRSTLRLALSSSIASDVANGLTRMGDLGIQIQKDGRFTVDDAVLEAKLTADGDAVARLFGVTGTTDAAALSFVSGGDATKAGSYAINVTQAAAVADVAGAGYGGAYVDDGVADTLTIRDLSNDRSYAVQLTNGMTMDDIVAALNAEFGTATYHELAASTALEADAGGTLAGEATTLDSLFAAGLNAGVANGDTITISGTNSTGTAFLSTFDVADVTTQTLGDLRSAVQAAVGSDVAVSFVGGRLTVTANDTGSSLMTLALSSDNAGGGNLSFGTVDVQTQGRSTVGITATNDAGQLRLSHANYGAAEGFEVSVAAGGTDGTASLGLAAGTYTGLDVAGTIGGIAATGSGRTLSGAAGTAVDGLMLQYAGTGTGAVGSLTFSRGIASTVRLAADPLLGTGAGSIQSLSDGLSAGIDRMNDRIEALEDRLLRRRESLVREFTNLEQIMARANAQSQWLQSQLQQLKPRDQ